MQCDEMLQTCVKIMRTLGKSGQQGYLAKTEAFSQANMEEICGLPADEWFLLKTTFLPSMKGDLSGAWPLMYYG